MTPRSYRMQTPSHFWNYMLGSGMGPYGSVCAPQVLAPGPQAADGRGGQAAGAGGVEVGQDKAARQERNTGKG
jgi:hypothetical protein